MTIASHSLTPKPAEISDIHPFHSIYPNIYLYISHYSHRGQGPSNCRYFYRVEQTFIWFWIRNKIHSNCIHIWSNSGCDKSRLYIWCDGEVGGVQPGERNQSQVSHYEMHFRDCQLLPQSMLQVWKLDHIKEPYRGEYQGKLTLRRFQSSHWRWKGSACYPLHLGTLRGIRFDCSSHPNLRAYYFLP